MSDLSPKRGFIERDDWDRIGSSKPPAPRIWPEASAANDDVRVLIIPNPDREPTPEELEALAERLYDAAKVSIDHQRKYRGMADYLRVYWRNMARAAWKLGARVPS